MQTEIKQNFYLRFSEEELGAFNLEWVEITGEKHDVNVLEYVLFKHGNEDLADWCMENHTLVKSAIRATNDYNNYEEDGLGTDLEAFVQMLEAAMIDIEGEF